EDVDISAGVTTAPEAADDVDLGARSALPKGSDERRALIVRLRRQTPAGDTTLLLERLEELRLLARPEALQIAKASRADGLLELLEGAGGEGHTPTRHH